MPISGHRETIGMRSGTWRSQPQAPCSRCCSFAHEACHSAVFPKILLAVVLVFATSDAAPAAEQSLWLENGRAVAQASEMLSAMRDAEIYGL